MTLGEKIKKLRIDNNMTQDDLARVCYVTRNAVSKWENNNGNPNLESIKLICEYFKLTIDEFLNNDLKNEEILKYSNYIIKQESNNLTKIKIVLAIIMIIFYPILQIGFREIVYDIDPTSGLSWGFVIAPFISMIYGIIICFVIKKCDTALLCGLLGLILTLLSEFILGYFKIIDHTSSIFLYVLSLDEIIPHLIYFIFYIIICLIAYSLKYQRIIFKDIKLIKESKRLIRLLYNTPKKKVIIAIILLSVTIIMFIVRLGMSIYNKINNIPPCVVFGMFNGVPLLFILIYTIPILLEVIFLISTIKNYKE